MSRDFLHVVTRENNVIDWNILQLFVVDLTSSFLSEINHEYKSLIIL